MNTRRNAGVGARTPVGKIVLAVVVGPAVALFLFCAFLTIDVLLTTGSIGSLAFFPFLVVIAGALLLPALLLGAAHVTAVAMALSSRVSKRALWLATSATGAVVALVEAYVVITRTEGLTVERPEILLGYAAIAGAAAGAFVAACVRAPDQSAGTGVQTGRSPRPVHR